MSDAKTAGTAPWHEREWDLVIMGAYSHARITEFLFGGVTRSILTGMPALTLMSR